jgi:hypothetical protein
LVAPPSEDATKAIILEVVRELSSSRQGWVATEDICKTPRIFSAFSGPVKGQVWQFINSQLLRRDDRSGFSRQISANLELDEFQRRANGQIASNQVMDVTHDAGNATTNIQKLARWVGG